MEVKQKINLASEPLGRAKVLLLLNPFTPDAFFYFYRRGGGTANATLDSVIPHAAGQTKKVAPDVITPAEQGPRSIAGANPAPATRFPKQHSDSGSRCGSSRLRLGPRGLTRLGCLAVTVAWGVDFALALG